MNDLDIIIELSHEFGTPDYVKGGGGNTSVKTPSTMWIKPSGTTLSGLTAETMVAMKRTKIDELYGIESPADSAEREELVKNLMAEAVENDAGRPSVEAPLHNVFDTKYVVHTHPVLVNGMTCALDGEAACLRLFPDALWVEYIDPGYTLCMEVRKRIMQYREEHGKEPALLVLENHGIFVAADSADQIRALYARVMDALKKEYSAVWISQTLDIEQSNENAETEEQIRAVFGDDAQYVVSSGRFPCTSGPITPDHMVYARAYPFAGDVTPAEALSYREEMGFAPKVVIAGNRVYGLGNSQKNAELALELTQDGALVLQLTEAFGGVRYMSDAHREFIENWEVESYRQQQV